jgi:hypothetical protein
MGRVPRKEQRFVTVVPSNSVVDRVALTEDLEDLPFTRRVTQFHVVDHEFVPDLGMDVHS